MIKNLNATTAQLVWEILNAALYDIEADAIDDVVAAICEAIKLLEGENK